MNKPSKLTTAVAFAITAIAITSGYIWDTYHPGSQFELFGFFMLVLCGGYTGKRLATRMEKFGGAREKVNTVDTDRGSGSVSDVSAGQQKD